MAEKKGLRVNLFTYKGELIGHFRAHGSDTPAFAWKDGELYVHGGERGTMRTLAPGERPVIAAIEASLAHARTGRGQK